METSAAQTQLNRIRYITEQFNIFSNQISIASIFTLILISNLSTVWNIDFTDAIFGPNNYRLGVVLGIVTFIAAVVWLILIAGYFIYTYGKIVNKPKPKTGNWFKDNREGITVLALAVIAIYIMLLVIKSTDVYFNIFLMIVQVSFVGAMGYKWLKSASRSVWYVYPLALCLLALLILWAAFSFDPKAHNSGVILLALVYLNSYVFELTYLIILVQTVRQTYRQNQAQVLFGLNLVIPANSLQIIFTILESCQSANNIYLQRFTGLDRENMLAILFQLQGRGLVNLEPNNPPTQTSKTPVRYNVSLTQYGKDTAQAPTSQLITESASF